MKGADVAKGKYKKMRVNIKCVRGEKKRITRVNKWHKN